MSKKKSALLLLITFVFAAVCIALPFLFVTNGADRAAWAQAAIAGAGLLFVAVTLELQRRQIHDNTEATEASTKLVKEQIALAEKSHRAAIRPILKVEEQASRGVYIATLKNVGKDIAFIKAIRYKHAVVPAADTFEEFAEHVCKHFSIDGFRDQRNSFRGEVALHVGEGYVIHASQMMTKTVEGTYVFSSQYDEAVLDAWKRMARAMRGSEITIDYSNVVDEREPSFATTLRVPIEGEQ